MKGQVDLVNKATSKFILFCITYAVLLAFGLYHIKHIAGAVGFVWGVIFPLILGCCIAFILSIPMDFIERWYDKKVRNARLKKFKRPISLVVTLILFVAVLLIVIFSVIPEIANTIAKIAEQVPIFVDNANRWFLDQGIEWEMLEQYIVDAELNWDAIKNNLFQHAKNLSSSVFSSTWTAAKSIFSGMTTFLLGLIFSIYILVSKEKLSHQALRMLYATMPKEVVEEIRYIASISHSTFSSFLSSQCLEALILGGMFFVSMTLLKMPYALLIGMVISITALVPIVGSFVGLVLGAFLILMVNPMQALWFCVLFLVLQQIEGNLIYPFVVGSSVGLPSIWVLLAVLVGGGTMGIIGMIIFIPIFSILYVLLGDRIDRKLKEKAITVKE